MEVAEEFGIDEATGKKVYKANVRQLPSPSVETDPITLNPVSQVSVNTRQPRQVPPNEQEIVQLVNDWAAAWGSKNIDTYQSFYDTRNFSSDGQNWREFKARKQGTFALYSSISVSVDNIKVISLSDTVISAEFVQQYVTENASRVSFKRLRLLKQQDDSWKIISEMAGR
jgi:ketosteroid isomerase-like protein